MARGHGSAMKQIEPGPFLERHYRTSLASLCLLCVALTIAFAWPAIVGFQFTDPDDIMRLLEVRAWLGGQSWFDVTQYRLDPPTGFAMHWSRFVDLPIGALIALFRPWASQRLAETLALVIVPVITLTIVTLTVSTMTRRLFGTGVALLAALFCFLNAGTFSAIWPMRIDHHGWEAAAGLGIAFFLTRDRRPRDAALAGLCAACWTHISLEGIAFTVGAAAWLGLRWLIAPVEERGRLPAFLAALAGAAILLFLATHRPALLARTYCDAISPVHIVVFATATLLTFAAAWLRPIAWPLRAAALAVAAVACGAIYVSWAPQCAKGPFATLSPLVYRIWYLNVLEGLPVWRQGVAGAAFWITCPLLGLTGAIVAIRTADNKAARQRLTDYAALLAIATLIGVLVLRACIFANLLALPGQAALIVTLLARVERWTMVARVLARVLAVVLFSPMGPPLILQHLAHPVATITHAPGVSSRCGTVDSFAPLDALPPTTFMTPFDIAPALIAGSHHDAIASGYHRNTMAMEDVLRFFGSDETTARAVARHHAAAYLAYCTGDNMISFMGRNYPAGIAAKLLDGKPLAWLQPVSISGTPGLKLYRIAH